jgi:hypothetical protein
MSLWVQPVRKRSLRCVCRIGRQVNISSFRTTKRSSHAAFPKVRVASTFSCSSSSSVSSFFFFFFIFLVLPFFFYYFFSFTFFFFFFYFSVHLRMVRVACAHTLWRCALLDLRVNNRVYSASTVEDAPGSQTLVRSDAFSGSHSKNAGLRLHGHVAR